MVVLYKQGFSISKTIETAFKSLLLQRLRSGLSILGIVCGVAAVLAMVSIGEGAKREALQQIEQLGTRNIYIRNTNLTFHQQQRAREYQIYALNLFDVQRISALSDKLDSVAYLNETNAMIIGTDKELAPQIVACSSSYANVLDLRLARGRFLSDMDRIDHNLVCVLGSHLAQQLGKQGRIGSRIRIENQFFEVVGILERFSRLGKKGAAIAPRAFNEMLFIPRKVEGRSKSNFHLPLREELRKIDEIIVKVKKDEAVPEMARVIHRVLDHSRKNFINYQIVIPQELLRQVQRTQRIFSIELGAIAVISLIVGGIGVMNIMLANVSERTHEIGIRRAVGATQKAIILQFLTEAATLTFIGGIIGIAVGFGAVFGISKYAQWTTFVSLKAVLIPLAMAIVTGLCFGLYPALKAAWLDPINALRQG